MPPPAQGFNAGNGGAGFMAQPPPGMFGPQSFQPQGMNQQLGGPMPRMEMRGNADFNQQPGPQFVNFESNPYQQAPGNPSAAGGLLPPPGPSAPNR